MKKLVTLVFCLVLGVLTALAAGAEGTVPFELQGDWNVQEMTDENGEDVMREIRSFEGSVRMSLEADRRNITISALGIENETSEKISSDPEGNLITESGVIMAWTMNPEMNTIAITGSDGTRILAMRPWTEWGMASIPEYPEIPVYRNSALEGDWTLIDFLLGKEEQYEIAGILYDGQPYAAQASIYGTTFRLDNRLTGEQIESALCEITPDEILVKDENGETTARLQYELQDNDRLLLTKDEDTLLYVREGSESATAAYEKLREIALEGYYDISFTNGELLIETYHGKTETLTIPDELEGYPVRYISTDALSDCPQITELTLPATLTAVGGQQLPNLQRIMVSEGNESLKTEDGVLFTADGKRLVQYPAADSRRSYTIPEGVREIGIYAFRNAGRLEEIIFPEYVESVGESAFADCTGLTEITLPAELQRLGADAFARCTSLRKAVIMYTDAETLSEKAFDGCDALTEIHTAAGTPAESIYRNAGRNVIADMPAYIWRTDDDGTLRITGSGILPVFNFNSDPWTGRRGEGKPVILYGRIDEGEWELELTGDRVILSGDSDLREYAKRDDMPWSAYRDRITTVRMHGKNINTAWAVDTDGLLTLTGEGQMAWFYVDDGPDDIRYVHPWDKWTVTKAVIGDGLTSVSPGILKGSKVQEVTIGSGVTEIGREAFYYCRDLRYVELPEGLTQIDKYAFAVCESLEQISIPASVTEIDDYAFNSCKSLQSVTLPEGLRTLGNCAFCECYCLKEIVVPDSVTTIGYSVFQSCPMLESIRLPRGMTEIPGGMFTGCSSLRAIQIPESVSRIGEGAFSGCTALETIYVPSGVTWIGDRAFNMCTSLDGIRCEADSYAVTWARMNGITPLNADGEPMLTEAEKAGQTVPVIKEITLGGSLAKDDDFNKMNEDVKAGFSMTLRADGYATLLEFMPDGSYNYQGSWKSVDGGIAVSFEAGNGIGDIISINGNGEAACSFYGRNISVRTPDNMMDFLAQTGFTRNGNDSQTQQAANGNADTDSQETVITVTPIITDTPEQQQTAPATAELTRPVPGSDTQVYSVVRQADASASITTGKNPTSYLPDKMIDGIDETSWQFSTKDEKSRLKEASAYFEFNGPTIVDEFWIKNGFWKITDGKDQYTQNCRVKELEISFRYEGSNDYTDPKKITLKDDQSAKKRKDWAKIDLGRHENVTGIRLRIISIYKGAKYKNDVCISEVLFVQNK